MKKRMLTGLFCMVVLFSISGCGKSTKKVVVASKPVTEQYILAEMISQLIEADTDIEVEKTLGIGGGTSNIHPAMVKGDIDIYPEYTGTGWLFVLKKELISDPKEMYASVKSEYKEKYNIEWLGLYGFNDTYTLAVKDSLAKEYKINTYSDLAKVSENLIFGAEPDFFVRPDGYEGLKKTYTINFKTNSQMDIGLKYAAIEANKVDVINAFSTDALLKKNNLIALVDDKNFFPSYQAATLIRGETLEKYPELKEVLEKMTGQISEKVMIDMNYEVESEKKDPADVAKGFLKLKGLLK
ncbi:MAG: glycine/betaine ABC transporter substrate-binding protein [Clostridiaceae bacterium]|nr:glycine/betaine ABC transporter substrate-binding protein [Clostridiaceae bacterium]